MTADGRTGDSLQAVTLSVRKEKYQPSLPGFSVGGLPPTDVSDVTRVIRAFRLSRTGGLAGG